MTPAILAILATAAASLTPATFDGRRVLVRLYPSDTALWAATGTVDDICLFVDFLRHAGRCEVGET